MKPVSLLSVLLSGIIVQPHRGGASRASDASLLAGGSSGSSLLVKPGMQTLKVSSSASEVACFSTVPWTSYHPWSLRRSWSSILSRAADELCASPPVMRNKNNITFEIAITKPTDVSRDQQDVSLTPRHSSLARPAIGVDARCIFNSKLDRSGKKSTRGYPNVIMPKYAMASTGELYLFQDDQTCHLNVTADVTQAMWESSQSLKHATLDYNDFDAEDRCQACQRRQNGDIVDANDDDPENQQTVQVVQSQVEPISELNKAKAVHDTKIAEAQLIKSNSRSKALQTRQNTTSALDIKQDNHISNRQGQLGLVIFFAFACALL